MNTAKIRQHLHNYLEKADDKKIRALYVMMENDINEQLIKYDDSLKAELDALDRSFRDGCAKTYSKAESKLQINTLLGGCF